MYAIAIVRYRRPLEEVMVHQEPHRSYLWQLKADRTLVAAGPQDPRIGGLFLLRVSDDTPQADLGKIRDDDPFYQRGMAQYELLPWKPVIGKEDLDKI
jgi:uncharacterized protein YciI